LAALPGAKRFAAQGHASRIYQAKIALQANSRRVLRLNARQVQVTANVSV